MPRSLAPSSSEDDLVFEDEKIEEILRQSTPDPRQSTAVSKESSSSSKNLEDIYFRGSRPRLDSTVDTTSAPISFANDSNDSIGRMRLQPFKELRFTETFRNHSIQTSNRQSTPVRYLAVPDPMTQFESRADPEMIYNGWGISYEVRSSMNQRKPFCIFCCCICFPCF